MRLNIVKSKGSHILPRKLEKRFLEDNAVVGAMHDHWLKTLAQKHTPKWARLLIKWFRPRWLIDRYRLKVLDVTNSRLVSDMIYKRRLEVYLRGKLVAKNWEAA